MNLTRICKSFAMIRGLCEESERKKKTKNINCRNFQCYFGWNDFERRLISTSTLSTNDFNMHDFKFICERISACNSTEIQIT